MTVSWVERVFSAKEEHTQWPAAGWWAASGQGNKQPHSTTAALPAITNQPPPAHTLALRTGEEGGDVPRGVLNCSGARSGPERSHCWNSAALAFTLKMWVLCKWTNPEEGLMSDKRCGWMDWPPLLELCLTAFVFLPENQLNTQIVLFPHHSSCLGQTGRWS